MIPSAYDLLVSGVALNAGQFLTTLLIFLRFRREAAAPPSGFNPPVTLVLAAKGETPGLAANVASLLDQDYPGKVDYLLAAPGRADPAWRALETVFSTRPGLRYVLTASERTPTVSSGKALDLVHAFRAAPPEGEVLVFADVDLRVGRGWLTALVAPLADPAVTAATSALLAAPDRRSFWGFLRSVWLGVTVGYWSFMGAACGQSLAMRRKDFYELDVPGCWEGALLEDLALTRLLRRAGRAVRFVALAMPAGDGACGRREFFDVFNRWVKCSRLFDPGVWLMGLAYLLVKAGITAGALLYGSAALALAFWLPDMVNAGLLFAVYRAYLPGSFAGLPPGGAPLPLLAGLASPALTAVYLANYAASLLGKDVRWGSYVYRPAPGGGVKAERV